MNDRQLRSFILAADLSSFSKAAEASYITTPALVQQINLLEKSVGFSLFVRQPRGVKLTAAGEQFYASAQEMLDIYDEACRKGREIEAGESATLRIACPDRQFPDFFYDVLQAFEARHPQVEIQFIDMPFWQHFDALRERRVDLTLTAQPNAQVLAQLHFTPLMQDTCLFCMRPNHPLAHHPRMTRELLDGAALLCGNYTYLKSDYVSALKGVPVKKMETEYGKSITLRVLRSDEIFIIHSQWGKIYSSFLAVVPSDIPCDPIGIVARKKASPMVQQFIQCAREHAPKA